MGEPAARAGQHRDDRLGDQRQVDRDAIPGLESEPPECRRHSLDLGVKLPVGPAYALTRLAFPEQRALSAIHRGEDADPGSWSRH